FGSAPGPAPGSIPWASCPRASASWWSARSGPRASSMALVSGTASVMAPTSPTTTHRRRRSTTTVRGCHTARFLQIRGLHRAALFLFLRLAAPQSLEPLAGFRVETILQPAGDIGAGPVVPHLLVPTG